MGIKNQNGFTIVEVSMFFAISALLLILLMAGISVAVAQQRFNDSVNSTQGFIQQQFNEAQNVINERENLNCSGGTPISPGTQVRGASNCVVIGKLIELTDNDPTDDFRILSSYNVIASNVDTTVAPYSSMTDLQVFSNVNPVVINTSESRTRFEIPWGIQTGTYRDSNSAASGDDVRYIALLRSPRSGVLNVYKIGGSIDTSNLATPYQQLAPGGSSTIEAFATQSLKSCFVSPDFIGPVALIDIRPLGSQDGVTTHFNDGSVEAFGC